MDPYSEALLAREIYFMLLFRQMQDEFAIFLYFSCKKGKLQDFMQIRDLGSREIPPLSRAE